jgi:hypothetical protein
MAQKDLSDSQRYDRILAGPSLPVYSITKSSQHQPGQIFTPELDYKTKFYATFHIDPSHEISFHLPSSSSSPTLRGHHTEPSPPAFLPASCQEYQLEDQSLPQPDQSYNRFHNVIPIKKLKQDLRDQKKKKSLEQTEETALLPIHKPSTNFLRGAVLRPSAHSKPSAATGTPAAADHGLNSSSSNLSQRPPVNFHPRVPPPSTPTSATAGAPSPHRSSSQPRPISPSTSPPAPTRRPPPLAGDDDTLQSSSSSLTSLPPHIIHGRLMGWKLTSPERRKELIQLFEDVRQSSQPGDDTDPRGELPEEVLEERRRVMKRQTEAYKATINRQSAKMKNKLKYSIQQSKRVAGSSEYPLAMASHGAATRYRNNHATPTLSTDPFQPLIERKKQKEMAMTKALSSDALSHIQPTSGDPDGLETLTSKWGFSSPATAVALMKPILPEYQTKARDPKLLFEHPDRMELLDSAASIEKAASRTISSNLEKAAAAAASSSQRARGRKLPTMGTTDSSVGAGAGAGVPPSDLQQQQQREREQQKLTKAVSEPFLRELSVRSANRKKRELAEERKEMMEKDQFVSVPMVRPVSSEGVVGEGSL